MQSLNLQHYNRNCNVVSDLGHSCSILWCRASLKSKQVWLLHEEIFVFWSNNPPVVAAPHPRTARIGDDGMMKKHCFLQFSHFDFWHFLFPNSKISKHHRQHWRTMYPNRAEAEKRLRNVTSQFLLMRSDNLDLIKNLVDGWCCSYLKEWVDHCITSELNQGGEIQDRFHVFEIKL